MRIAYAQPGAVCSAFAPVPAWAGFGLGPWAAKQNVSGQPGTQGVPAGLPDFGDAGLHVNGQPVRGGGAGYAHGSGTMPGVWYPQQWYLTTLDGFTLRPESGNQQAPSVYSDNQMPVPAANPLGRAAVLARPPVFLSGGNLEQPAGSRGPAWPRWLPGMSYGG
jgi:hypothetical protein